MANINFSIVILYLAIYSIMGWLCEVLYCSLPANHFVNRGFLHGPYCPIYGVGAMFTIILTQPVTQNPLLVFLVSLCAATSLEYFTGWIMEALFQVRWWDYSNYKINLNGRICLKNSFLFGILGICAVYSLHPLAADLIKYIPGDKQRVLASTMIVGFFMDLIFTLNALLKFTERLKAIQAYLSEIEQYNEKYAWLDKKDLSGSILRLKEICTENSSDEKLANILNKLIAITEKRGARFRLLTSFPHLTLMELDNTLRDFSDYLEERKESVYKRFWQHTVNITKETASSVAIGLNFYKLFWVFVSASVLGYVVETIFCLVTRGVIESRQGLLYGPFSQVYGMGAVLIVLLLTPLAKKSDRWLFFGGMLIGGAFEYLCSFVQENVFHSVSWEYSRHAFSIGGRTNLTYMFFWGILGLIFIKDVYPHLSHMIEHMPKRQGRFFSWVLIIMLSLDTTISATAVYRWSERLKDIQPANAYEDFLDKHYPNTAMEEIYPNMTMVEKI